MTRINTMIISNGIDTTAFTITLTARTRMKFVDYVLSSITRNLSIQEAYTHVLLIFGQVSNSRQSHSLLRFTLNIHYHKQHPHKDFFPIFAF